MTMDNLTIRIYPDPSYLKLIDNHVCRYYPITDEAVKIPKDHEFYGEMEWALEESDDREDPSYVVEIEGTFYRYYYNSAGFYDYLDSLLPEKCSSRTATWMELPENIRNAYVRANFKEVSLKERYELVYGKEKAEQILEHEQWVETHIVYDEETTLMIEEKIGRFDKVKVLNSGYFSWVESSAEDITDKTKIFHFLLDNQWFVTVIEQPNPFEDIEYGIMLDICKLDD